MPPVDQKLAARLASMTSEQKLDAVLTMLVRIERRLGAGGDARPAEATVASDAELDSKYGDEEIRKDPKRWKNQSTSYAGKRMSETEPDYLDVVAEFGDWASEMSEGKAKDLERAGDNAGAAKERTSARYRRMTARRAKGWAARLRAGWVRPGSATPEAPSEPTGDESESEENW